MKGLFRILAFFAPIRRRVFFVIFVGALSILMYAFMPSFLQNTFTELRQSIGGGISDPMFSVIKHLAIFGTLALFNALFDVFCSCTLLRAENDMIIEKLTEMKKKLDVVSSSFLEKFTVGDLSRRVANMTEECITNSLITVYTIARVVVFFATTLIVMYSINWILASVVLLSLPLCILTARFVSRRTQKYYSRNGAALTTTYSFINQKFSMQEFFSVHGLGDGRKQFSEINQHQRKTTVAENLTIAFNTIYINFFQNFMYLLITFLFAVLYVTQIVPTEFGVLPAFIMYSNRFLANSVVVTTTTNLIQVINAKSLRVFEILDCPEDVTEREHVDISKIKKSIVFENVCLVQDGEMVLDKVSFTIPQGASAAFVGPAGSGKIYLIELLAKLSMPTSGRITVDGLDLNVIRSRSYYKCVGISLEAPFIFRGTVAENLLYGVRRELPENVMTVAEKLNCNSFIENLENGYETYLVDNSSLVGTGQRQLLSVARLVLQSPDVAIFSQSLSAVDTVTERNVYEKIMKHKRGQTTIFATHRLHSVENCDIIFYLEKGQIVEQGTHQELMERRGRYFSAFTAGVK